MKSMRVRTAALLGLAVSVACYTTYRLIWIDTMTGFLDCVPPLHYLFYILMAAPPLYLIYAVYAGPTPEDPVSGGHVLSQLIVMAVGLSAVALSLVMVTELIALLPNDSVTLGAKVSRVIGVPLSMVGGAALIYAGYDYTNLSTRSRKASFALIGAAMQTYMLLYRFPELLEVTTAPAQTLELFYLLSAALFMLFWARTLSGEANSRQNRLTYMAGGVAAITGTAYLVGELAVGFFLSDVLPVNEMPLLNMAVMATVSVMALDFVMAHGPRRQSRQSETAAQTL